MSETSDIAVETRELRRDFGQRRALDGLSFRVRRGELFAFLGPNGGGKTTLFRILSTLIAPSSGEARVGGCDVLGQADQVRRKLGVVFQSPSLDKKLRVDENLRHQGHLYGLSGRILADRIAEGLRAFGLQDRSRDLVETLSGGLARRAEIAKSLLHEPEILLLDEPSAGLDPGARIDLWAQLEALRGRGMTILVTTHLMDEAERADRLLILHQGQSVALGSPAELRQEIGGAIVTLSCAEPDATGAWLEARGIAADRFDRRWRFESEEPYAIAAEASEALPSAIASVTVGRPTLEDVFVKRTGHQFWGADTP